MYIILQIFVQSFLKSFFAHGPIEYEYFLNRSTREVELSWIP